MSKKFERFKTNKKVTEERGKAFNTVVERQGKAYLAINTQITAV